MSTYKLNVNGETRKVEAHEDMPLLWVLRDRLGLVGAKYGCGIGLCGACTVHMNDAPIRSCMVRVADVGDAQIKSIEGLAEGARLHPLQKALVGSQIKQLFLIVQATVLAVQIILVILMPAIHTQFVLV